MAETLTLAELLDGVAANMDTESGDYTGDEADYQQWACEGLDFLAQIAKDFALESYLVSSTAQVNGSEYPAAVKIIRVAETDGSEAHYVPTNVFTHKEQLFANGSRSFGPGQQIWSIVKGKVKVFRTATTIDIHYVPVASFGGNVYRKNDGSSYRLKIGHTSSATDEPGTGVNWSIFWTEVTYDDTHTAWETATPYDSSGLPIPNGWKGLIVDYATYKAKMADEELDQAQALWNAFLQGLQRFQGFDELPKTVGG